MFNKLRYSIGEKKLSKKAAQLHRQKQVHNFNTCKSATILVDATKPEDFVIVKEFMKYLTSLKIESSLIGYVNADQVSSHLLLRDNCHFFCNKDLNLFYKPKTTGTDEFLNKRFDILFDLSLKDYYPLRFLTTLSLAQFKVGRFSEGVNDLDLMIDVRKEPKISYLIDQIKIYVNILNNPQSGIITS
jgi:hypothetical protein